MKRITPFTLLLLFSASLFCQINMSDSTASVVAYWNMGDSLTYDVTRIKYNLKGDSTAYDTTDFERVNYEVDIFIRDSTENSYMVEWYYKNHTVESENPIAQKLAVLSKDISIKMKTSELGVLDGVENWEEVRDYLNRVLAGLQSDFDSIPNGEQILKQVKGSFQTKDGVERNAIQDATQFYSFHGRMFNYQEELTGEFQLPNNFDGTPMKADFKVWLDEIDAEGDNYIMRYYQVVDPADLKKVTYDFLIKTGTFGDQPPNIDSLPDLSNEIFIASRIHGSTGWPIYTVETRIVKAEDVITHEERVIQLK